MGKRDAQSMSWRQGEGACGTVVIRHQAIAVDRSSSTRAVTATFKATTHQEMRLDVPIQRARVPERAQTLGSTTFKQH